MLACCWDGCMWVEVLRALPGVRESGLLTKPLPVRVVYILCKLGCEQRGLSAAGACEPEASARMPIILWRT